MTATLFGTAFDSANAVEKCVSIRDAFPKLFDFLLQCVKQRTVEKRTHADLQAVTYLLDRDDPRIFAFDVQHKLKEDGRKLQAEKK